MAGSPPAKLTPSQRAGLVAFHLAQGEGLTLAQMRRIAQYPRRTRFRPIRQMLSELQTVLDVRLDEAGMWSLSFRPVRHRPRSARGRAAWLAYRLAVDGEVRTREICGELGVSRQAAFILLRNLSCVLPLYTDAAHRGIWRVLDLRELDD